MRLFALDDDVIAVARWNDGERAVCALSRSDQPKRLRVAPDDAPEVTLGEGLCAEVPPRSAILLRGPSCGCDAPRMKRDEELSR